MKTDKRLTAAWATRKKLHAEGGKLHAEGDKLYAEGRKLWAEGDKLWAEGDKLHAEGDLVFIEEVILVHGPKTVLTWTDTGCELSTGEVFS